MYIYIYIYVYGFTSHFTAGWLRIAPIKLSYKTQICTFRRKTPFSCC